MALDPRYETSPIAWVSASEGTAHCENGPRSRVQGFPNSRTAGVTNRAAIPGVQDQGEIEITADLLLVSPDSLIDAENQVILNAPETRVETRATPLTVGFLDASRILAPTCAARTAEQAQQGSFYVAQRRGLPASPEGLLLSFEGADEPLEPILVAQNEMSVAESITRPPPGDTDGRSR